MKCTPVATTPSGYHTSFECDPAANRQTLTDPNGRVTTWTYDDADRLTGQQRSGEAATFVYDSMGNVLVKAHEGAAPVTMAYDAANQVTMAQQGAAVTTFTHDAAGNLTVENAGGSLTTHTWDGENRLTQVAAPGGIEEYLYDAEGLRRSAQEGGGALTTFVWDGDDYVQERTAGGVVRYVTVGGEVVAEKRDGERRLHVPDPLGSTVALVNAAGAVSDTFRYWPYGEEAARTGTPTPFRYVGTAGYYRDRPSSIYVRARHLRPDLARWASADPLGWDGGGWSAYAYAAGAPTVWVAGCGIWLALASGPPVVVGPSPSEIEEVGRRLLGCDPDPRTAAAAAAGISLGGAAGAAIAVVVGCCVLVLVALPGSTRPNRPRPMGCHVGGPNDRVLHPRPRVPPPQLGRKPHPKPEPSPVDPGRDPKGKCLPCPANIVRVHTGHGHSICPGAHWECLEYHQNKTTCLCYISNRVFGWCIPPPAPAAC